jgi:TPR repeat protein
VSGKVVAANEPEAARYTKLAADQNDAWSQFNYAFCLAKGRDFPKNEAEATQYYKLAAEPDDADAQYGYALCVAKRPGVPKDEAEAARYYKLAVSQDDANANMIMLSALRTDAGRKLGLAAGLRTQT